MNKISMNIQRRKIVILSMFFGLLFTSGLYDISQKTIDPFLTAQVKPLDYTPSITSEPRFSSQFHLSHINRTTKLDTFRGEGVTVAIIDSGINVDHQDFWSSDGLTTNILASSAYIEEVGSSTSSINIQTVAQYGIDIIDDDEEGHGTNVAGTIAAMVNGVGSAGVSPAVNLLILKTQYYFTEIARAIRYAADNGANVINMSIGAYATSFTDGFGDQQTAITGADTYFQSAINYAYNKGVTIVAAAGNEKTSQKSYPASNTNVIGVGALGRNSSTSIANYSNFGTDNVTLVAPGSVYVADIGSSSSFVETQGTSFASPIVASAAALYKGAHPSATPAQVTAALTSSAYDLGTIGVDATFGHGRLDVSALLPANIPVTGVELTPSETTLRVEESLTLTANILPSNATDKEVIFISENEAVATVDEDSGVVTAVSPGTAIIGVLTNDGSFDDYATITVVSADVVFPVTNITSADSSLSLNIGAVKTLNLTLSPSNANLNDVTFTSANPGVASVSASGVVTAVGVGNTTINIVAKEGSGSLSIPVSVTHFTTITTNYTFTSKSWAATPTNWVSTKDGLAFLNGGVQVTTGSSGAGAISPISYSNMSSVTIGYATNASSGAGSIKLYYLTSQGATSSRTLIGSFTVSTSGGTTKRNTTAYVPSSSQNTGYLQIEVTCTTNSIYICDISIESQVSTPVNVPVESVAFTTLDQTLITGNTLQLAYVLLPTTATNKNVSFSSSSPSIATVSGTGLVTAVSQGVTTIKVTTVDGGLYDEVEITVQDPVVYEELLTLDTTSFKTSYTFGESLALSSLSATFRNSSGITSSVSYSALTLVSGNTKTLGEVELVFQYAGATDSVTISVTNVGAIQGGGLVNGSLLLHGDGFNPALTTTATDYSSISLGGYNFSASKLRISGFSGSTNLFIAQDGQIHNITSFGSISSLKFDYLTDSSAAAVQTVRFASSELTNASGTVTQTISTSTPGSSTTVVAPANSSHFRIDITNKNIQMNITINYSSGTSQRFTNEEQADAYINYFMARTSEECAVNDVQASTWGVLKTEYLALSGDVKLLVKTRGAVNLVPRYKVIEAAYNYDDFMEIVDALSTNYIPPSSRLLMILTISGFALSILGSVLIKKKW